MPYALEFMHINTSEITFFLFTNNRVENNICYGLIDCIFLIVMKLFISA